MEPASLRMKFKTILSNPIQISISRYYQIHSHQNTKMRQDLNPNPFMFISGHFWAGEGIRVMILAASLDWTGGND